MRARAALAFSSVLLALGGCARIIGAGFDDARLGSDAGVEGGEGDVAIVDDGSSGDAQPDANVDPRALGDLELWLAADRQTELDDTFDAASVEDASYDAMALARGVAIWRDQSGHAHDGLQLEPSMRPLLVAPAGDAGHPVVRFERQRGSCLSLTWSATFGAAGATFFVVTRGDAAPVLAFESASSEIVFPHDTRYGEDAAPDPVLLVAAGDASASVRSGGDGGVHLRAARLRPGELGGVETWLDGEPVERGSLLVDAMPPVAAMGLGCAPGASEAADGDVMEVLAYGEPLTDAGVAAVEAYLRARFGL